MARWARSLSNVSPPFRGCGNLSPLSSYHSIRLSSHSIPFSIYTLDWPCEQASASTPTMIENVSSNALAYTPKLPFPDNAIFRVHVLWQMLKKYISISQIKGHYRHGIKIDLSFRLSIRRYFHYNIMYISFAHFYFFLFFFLVKMKRLPLHMCIVTCSYLSRRLGTPSR